MEKGKLPPFVREASKKNSTNISGVETSDNHYKHETTSLDYLRMQQPRENSHCHVMYGLPETTGNIGCADQLGKMI